MSPSLTDGSDEDLVVRLRHLTELAARDGRKIPDESALAVSFGVSRAKLREALARLEHEGAISRRRRTGIRANLELPQIGSRFDLQIDYAATLTEAGHVPTVRVVSVSLGGADAECAEIFRIDLGTPVLVTQKVWLADGVPAMTARDRLPAPGLHDLGAVDAASNVFALATQLSGEPARWEVSRPSAVGAPDDIAALLTIPTGQACFTLNTLGVSERGKRVYDSLEHHVPGVVDFGLVRTVLG